MCLPWPGDGSRTAAQAL